MIANRDNFQCFQLGSGSFLKFTSAEAFTSQPPTKPPDHRQPRLAPRVKSAGRASRGCGSHGFAPPLSCHARAVSQWPPSLVRIVPPSSSTEANRKRILKQQKPMGSRGRAYHWLRAPRGAVWASASVTLEPRSPRGGRLGLTVSAPALARCSNLPHPGPLRSFPCPPQPSQAPPTPSLADRRRGPRGENARRRAPRRR